MRRAAIGVIVGVLFFSGCQCEEGPVGQLQGSLELTPSRLDFGPVGVAQTKSVPLTVRNAGTFRLDLSGFAATPPFATTQAPLSLSPGETADVAVTLAPEDLGDATGTLTFATTDADAPTVEVPLAGTGVDAAVTVDPALVDFGDVIWQVASPTAYLPVKIGNDGTASFEVTGLELTDDGGGTFGVDPGDAVRSYAPGDSGTFEVHFLAAALGATSGTLRIATTARTQPEIVVPLQGKAVGPAIEVCTSLGSGNPRCTPDPVGIDFGPVALDETAVATVRATNTGDRDLRISALKLSGTSDDFSLSPAFPADGLVVAAGDTAEWDVGYAPSNFGTDAANVSLLSNDRAHPGVVVALAGRARRADIEVVPRGITMSILASAGEATQPVRLYNCGDDPLEIGPGEITLTQTSGEPGAFSLTGVPPAGTVLEPLGLDCTGEPAQATLTLVFSPPASGNYGATITVPSNDPVDPVVTVEVLADKR